jgi:C4-dicarboxylate transporter DctM subunit
METFAVIALFAGLIICIVAGIPLVLAMLVPSVVVTLLFGLGTLNGVVSVMFGSVNSYTLIAIPLFILVGKLMTVGGLASDMVALIARVIGRGKPGSAGYITVGASLFFAGVSGSSTADTAALSTMMEKPLRRDGFSRGYIGALTTVGGGLGLIIPPSIMLVIFGVVANVSIGKLFFAGVIPGLILTLTLGLAVSLEVRKITRLARVRTGSLPSLPDEDPATSGSRLEQHRGWLGLGAPIIILGGIYLGLLTPTESAAAAAAYVLIVTALFYRNVSWKQIYDAFKESAILTSIVMVLTAAGGVFAWVVVKLNVARYIDALLEPLGGSPILLVALVLVIMGIAGMFIEPIPLIYLFVPIVVPPLLIAGVDMVAFGVLFTMMLSIGQATPPVGANLFVASAVLKVPFEEIVNKLPLLLLSMVIPVLLVLLFPILATWLPELLFR